MKTVYAVVYFAVAIIGTLIGMSTDASAATLTVCASGCDHTAISDALLFAAEGDVVEVQSTYDASGETYALTFLNASTTLNCTGGAVIGQSNPSGANDIYLTTSSTISGCTFTNINIRTVSLSAEPLSGVRVVNNVFSSSATGSIDFVYGAKDFEISGNTNINFLNIAATGTNGLIQNNTFYGRMPGRSASIMFATSASSSQLRIIGNTFTNYTTDAASSQNLIAIEGNDMIFATNTVRYAADPVSTVYASVVFNASGTNYVAGNFIESPSEFASCNPMIIFSVRDEPWQATYGIYHNTIVLRGNCSNGKGIEYNEQFNSASIEATINADYNLIYNAVSSTSANSGIYFSLGGTSAVLTQSNSYNAAYNFSSGTVYRSVSGGTNTDLSDATSRTEYPFLKIADADTANNLETAAFSPMLDVNGTLDIGATNAARRSTITIDDNGTIDYSSIDATSTYDLVRIARTGDDFTLAAGTYSSFNIGSTYATSSITIQGVGATTIVDAQSSGSAITFTNVSSSSLSSVLVQNAAGSGGTAYTITKINGRLGSGGAIYNEANGVLGSNLGDMAIFPSSVSCDPSFVTADGEDITSVTNSGTSNFHSVLMTLAGSRNTYLIPSDQFADQTAFEAFLVGPCELGLPDYSIEAFADNAFTASGGVYTYDASSLVSAGIVIAPSITDPPAITATPPVGAGIKIAGTSNHITISSVTSTSNEYGIYFATVDNGFNTLSESTLSSNSSYDVASVSSATNTFDNVSFTRTSSTVSGDGPILVRFKLRIQALRSGNSSAITVASATSTDAASTVTALGTTNAGSGYSAYTLLPAYRITASSDALTNGGYNPYALGALAGMYSASSTSVTLASRNQSETIYLISSISPTAPSDPVVSVGVTTSTLSWTDNSDDETSFVIDYVDLSAGESYPGTSASALTDATSYTMTSLLANTTYQARVQATSTSGGSAHVTSSAFTTKAAVPGAPTVSATSRTSVTVTIDANSNSTSTEYAIYSSTLGGYLTALGVADASPTWQTTSTWSTLTVSSLTCATTYGFSVIARNLDSVLTATSTASSVATSACATSESSSSGSGGGGTSAGSGSSASPSLFSFAPTAAPLPTSSPVILPSSGEPSTPVVSPPIDSPEPILPPASERVRRTLAADARAFGVRLATDWEERLATFVENGSSEVTRRLGEGERRALIRDLLDTMRRENISSEDMERVANGQIPRGRNYNQEVAQLPRVRATFRSIYGHDPNFQNQEENLAWNTLMYRIRFPRDLAAEREGIVEFRRLFRRTPSDPFQWATVRVLGYVDR